MTLSFVASFCVVYYPKWEKEIFTIDSVTVGPRKRI